MSWTANTATWPPHMASMSTWKSRGLKVTGQAARMARLVMNVVSRMRGMESPSAPTDHPNPSSGSHRTCSTSCNPSRLGS